LRARASGPFGHDHLAELTRKRSKILEQHRELRARLSPSKAELLGQQAEEELRALGYIR
jgi:hypothetical protein